MAYRRHNQSNVNLKASCSSQRLWYPIDGVLLRNLQSTLAFAMFISELMEKRATHCVTLDVRVILFKELSNKFGINAPPDAGCPGTSGRTHS